MNDANGKQLKSTKRQKFERKQQQKQDQIERERYYDEFVERNSNCCHMISDDWCKEIVNDTSQESFVQGLVKPYLNLKENTNNNNRSNRLFILEGAESVRVLIQQAAATIKHRWKINDKGKSICSTGDFVGVELVSILVKPATFWEAPVCLLKDVEQSAVDLQADREINNRGTYGQDLNIPYDVLIGKESTLSSIAGFHIARGALACGKVPEYLNEEWLKAYLQKLTSDKNRRSLRLLALDGVCDTANMGSMIRTSKAFDVDAILLSSNCCDPWSRRSVRVSMGYVCSVPVIQTKDRFSTFLNNIKSIFQLELFAAVVDDNSEFLHEIKSVNERWCCVMGNEGNGISNEVIEICDTKVKISISANVDSLSVGVATGVMLNGLRERDHH